MNLEILQEDSEGMEGQLKSWWSKLTKSDLKVIKDKNEQLLEILQERYGWSKTHAKKEIRSNLENYQHLQSEHHKEDIMVHQPRPDKKNAQFSPSRQGVRPDDSPSGKNRMNDNNHSQEEYDAQPSQPQYGRDDEHRQQNQGHNQPQTGNYCSHCGSYIGKNSNKGRQDSADRNESSSFNRSEKASRNDEDNDEYATNQSGMQKKQNESNMNQKNKDQQANKSGQSKPRR